MIVALADNITLTDLQLRAYEQILEPKKLVTVEGGTLRSLSKTISARPAKQPCGGFANS